MAKQTTSPDPPSQITWAYFQAQIIKMKQFQESISLSKTELFNEHFSEFPVGRIINRARSSYVGNFREFGSQNFPSPNIYFYH